MSREATRNEKNRIWMMGTGLEPALRQMGRKSFGSPEAGTNQIDTCGFQSRGATST